MEVNRFKLCLFMLSGIALLIVGAVNPYLRAHSFLVSPAMLLAYGITLSFLIGPKLRFKGWGQCVALGGLCRVPLLVMQGLSSSAK